MLTPFYLLYLYQTLNFHFSIKPLFYIQAAYDLKCLVFNNQEEITPSNLLSPYLPFFTDRGIVAEPMETPVGFLHCPSMFKIKFGTQNNTCDFKWQSPKYCPNKKIWIEPYIRTNQKNFATIDSRFYSWDLFYPFNIDENCAYLIACDTNVEDFVIFSQTKNISKFTAAELENKIVECEFNMEKNIWIPIKIRSHERSYGNSLFTIEKTIQNINENITIEELSVEENNIKFHPQYISPFSQPKMFI